uniref:Uncharacterized protein n=1 Tax=viral metagenome TaxID=1070528 RepID=A0A6C0CSH4_9ZZZZ
MKSYSSVFDAALATSMSPPPLLSSSSGTTATESVPKDTTQHVLTLTSTTNPTVFSFDNIYEQVTSIETLKTRFKRSEYTCEWYRNTPFVVLTVDAQSLITFDNNLLISFQNELGVDASTIFDVLQSNVQNAKVLAPHTPYFQFTATSSMSDGPLHGLCPYVLNNQDYTNTTLVQSILNISENYLAENVYVSYISMSYNSTIKRFYFQSSSLFYMFPSNAASVVGLRDDTIYISQLDTNSGLFTVYADLAPKFNGPDVLFIENEESYPSFKNIEYISLNTIYLPDSGYTFLNTQHDQIVQRKMQIIHKLPKLTITIYSDLANKILYITNGQPWFMEIIIVGKV